MFVGVLHYFEGLCFVPLVDISVLVPVSCCFDYCSLVIYLKLGSMMPPALLSLLRMVLVVWALFPMKFKVVFSSSVKKVIGSLMWIALNL